MFGTAFCSWNQTINFVSDNDRGSSKKKTNQDTEKHVFVLQQLNLLRIAPCVIHNDLAFLSQLSRLEDRI